MRSVRNASIRFICLLPAACCLFLVGCNNGKQLQADLYQRELRLQEDEIYRLEDNIEEYQAIVRGYRCEMADLKRELSSAQTPSALAPTPSSKQPTPAEDPIGEIDIQPFSAPEIESLPLEAAPRFTPAPDAPEAPAFTPGADTALPDRAARLALHEEAESAALNKKQANAAAVEVTLPSEVNDVTPPLPFPATKALPIAESSIEPLPYEEPILTKTAPKEITILNEIATPLLKMATVDSIRVDLKNGPPETTGEATLIARLSPLSSEEPAYFDGEASVLIADMSQSGSARRIGRWDFTTDEVAQSWAENSTQLELPLLLPVELISKIPTDRPLRLWVRLVDSRGRKTLHSMDIDFLNHPWRLAETRPLESIQARPIEMASLSLRRLPVESTEPPEDSTQERVAQSQDQSNQAGWRRAVLHRSNTRSTHKRDDAVTPAMHTIE